MGSEMCIRDRYPGFEVISEKATEPDEVRYEPVADDNEVFL